MRQPTKTSGRRHGAKHVRENTLRAAESSFVQGDDGFWLFWPTENKGGWQEQNLRIIANELARRNAPIQTQLEKDLEAAMTTLGPNDFAKPTGCWMNTPVRYKK